MSAWDTQKQTEPACMKVVDAPNGVTLICHRRFGHAGPCGEPEVCQLKGCTMGAGHLGPHRK